MFQTLTGPGMTDPEQARNAVDYEMSIFAEDLDLQENALSGLEFPLDPATELHTKADRVSVEFRRVLAEALKDLSSAIDARRLLRVESESIVDGSLPGGCDPQPRCRRFGWSTGVGRT